MTKKFNLYHISMIVLFGGFLVWAGKFIYNASFVANDGQRYYMVFDDALISMRYAWNLTHSKGLVWNPLEYVEGYTNLLMTLWMGVGHLLIQDKRLSALFTLVSSVAFFLITVWIALKLAGLAFPQRSERSRQLSNFLIAFGLLTYYPLIFWAVVGMETTLQTMLLGFGIWQAVAVTQTTQPARWRWWAAAVAFGLAMLTRPDSLVVAGLGLGYVGLAKLWPEKHPINLSWGELILGGGLFVSLPAAQFAMRQSYYGEWLPNTYTLKVAGIPMYDRLVNGWVFIQPHLTDAALLWLVALIGLVVSPRRVKGLLLGLWAATAAYQVYVGGDPWNYWRITSPAMPGAFILFANELVAGAEWIAEKLRRVSALPAIGMALIVALLAAYQMDIRYKDEIVFNEVPANLRNTYQQINIAILLNDILEPQARIGVIWAGTMPYYTDFYAIDYLGKSDKYIAQLPPDLSGAVSAYGMYTTPGHNKYDLNYSIKELQPTYTQRVDWGAQDISPWTKQHYISVNCDQIPFGITLLEDSDVVNWEIVEQRCNGYPRRR